MSLRMKLPSEYIAQWIEEQLEKRAVDYDQDDEGLYLDLFEDIFALMKTNITAYHMIMGTMITNYFEELFGDQEDDTEMMQVIKTDDFDSIVDYILDHEEEQIDMIEITRVKHIIRSKDANELLYLNTVNNGFAYIYEKCNPFYKTEKLFHEFNYPTDQARSLERDFINYYHELQEALEYPEHIQYVLTDLLQNKWPKVYSKTLLECFLKTNYYYIKGVDNLYPSFLTGSDRKFIQDVESATSLENIKEKYATDSKKLNYLVGIYCFYQDHLCDDVMISIRRQAKETQYMKKLSLFNEKPNEKKNN